MPAWRNKYLFSTEPRLFNLRGTDLVGRDGEYVPVNDNEIGRFPYFDRAELFIPAQSARAVYCVSIYRITYRNTLRNIEGQRSIS